MCASSASAEQKVTMCNRTVNMRFTRNPLSIKGEHSQLTIMLHIYIFTHTHTSLDR